MAKLVTGLFKTRAAAEAAVDAIIKRGYTRDDISVLMSDATKHKEFAIESGTHAAQGAVVGGTVGGVTVAALAAIAAVGTSLVLPGIGLVIAEVMPAPIAIDRKAAFMPCRLGRPKLKLEAPQEVLTLSSSRSRRIRWKTARPAWPNIAPKFTTRACAAAAY